MEITNEGFHKSNNVKVLKSNLHLGSTHGIQQSQLIIQLY